MGNISLSYSLFGIADEIQSSQNVLQGIGGDKIVFVRIERLEYSTSDFAPSFQRNQTLFVAKQN